MSLVAYGFERRCAVRVNGAWTVLSVCLGAASLWAGTWSLSVLSSDPNTNGAAFFRALLYGAPGSLSLAVGGVISAFVGLVRQRDKAAFAGLAVCVAATVVGGVVLVVVVVTMTLLS